MRITTLLLIGALGCSTSGCRWFDRARAEEHDNRAKENAKSLNLGAALDEHDKANKAREAVKKDPLP